MLCFGCVYESEKRRAIKNFDIQRGSRTEDCIYKWGRLFVLSLAIDELQGLFFSFSIATARVLDETHFKMAKWREMQANVKTCKRMYEQQHAKVQPHFRFQHIVPANGQEHVMCLACVVLRAKIKYCRIGTLAAQLEALPVNRSENLGRSASSTTCRMWRLPAHATGQRNESENENSFEGNSTVALVKSQSTLAATH